MEIEEAKLAPAVLSLRDALRDAVCERFGAGSAPNLDGDTSFYYAATFLDHRKLDLPSISRAHSKVNGGTRAFTTTQAASWMMWELGMSEAQEKKQQQQQRGGGEGAGTETDGKEDEGGGGGGAGANQEEEEEEEEEGLA